MKMLWAYILRLLDFDAENEPFEGNETIIMGYMKPVEMFCQRVESDRATKSSK